MPKGGELHYHLAGGAYPQTMIKLAAQGKYCLQQVAYSVVRPHKNCVGSTPAQALLSNSSLYQNALRAWSMKDFNGHDESGHDHFFKSFYKFGPIVQDYRAQLLVDILERAADQNEQYLEIMVLADHARSSRFADKIKKATTFEEKKRILLNNKEFNNNILYTVNETESLLKNAQHLMKCDRKIKHKACQLTVKFQYHILRTQNPDEVFAQALNGFAAISKSKHLVGINLVQAEDHPVALRDYQHHMTIFNYLHQHFPSVHIALHAGELMPGMAEKQHLKSHIRDAIIMGQAERIGHGVAISHEENHKDTLNLMRRKQIAVEINLTSNRVILSLAEKDHPIQVYLSHKVPVVLSTDDEGILQTDLTTQYVDAVKHLKLSYSQLKQINRNSLTYSFLPGKSLWADAANAIPVNECIKLKRKKCKEFIQNNPKAKLQWLLEQRLEHFEQHYKHHA